MKINYETNSNSILAPFKAANKHFSVAFVSKDKIQSLYDRKIVEKVQNPQKDIFLSERVTHFILGCLEYLPIINYIVLFVDRYFNQISFYQNVFGKIDPKDKKLIELINDLSRLSPMDKVTMSGSCDIQTTRMENFLRDNFGMRNIPDQFFVQGVRAFEFTSHLRDEDPNRVITIQDEKGNAFQFTVQELLNWQDSFRTFASREIYGEEGRGLIHRSLQGQSAAGEEAWKMKFLVRISQNPIFSEFDGNVINRTPQEQAGLIYLISVCGPDFAGRAHDIDDIRRYITNWKDVYRLDSEGNLLVERQRDFIPTGQKANLNEDLLFKDLKKMAKLRLDAQHQLGIEVVVETGIGLGVFAGDRIGIGERVRELSARALKEVLEENSYPKFKLVCCAMPIFKQRDNFHVFAQQLEGYKGKTPIYLLDQDMHKIARTSAVKTTISGEKQNRFITSELNPADSHGVVGEYWQNRGPGTEEKLALTTAALLTQHHAVNPRVLDQTRYDFI